jgi:uncharacterized coiled-coil protein SlyX
MTDTDPSESSRSRDADVRLTRIEESLGFAQHDLDELSTQVRALHDSLAAMAKKLDRLERRLYENASGDNEPENGAETAGH